jgi:Big-like domain-containing protein/carboxypeptidase family protein
MKRLCLLAITSVGLAMLVACAADTNQSPAAPAPAGGVFEIRITSAAPSDATIQLTATARLADGSSRDVTTSAVWTSSNPALATVSASGLVTAVGAGQVEVRASYQGVMGTLTLQVDRPIQRFALSGVVHEVGPAGAAVANARVEIVRGPGAGAFVTTDGAGIYRLPGLNGLVDITASKDGFIDWRLSNLTVDRDMHMDVTMYPTPPTDAAGARATARCTDGSWSWSQTVGDACTAHGGILYTVCPGILCAAQWSRPSIR